jgi:enoyl-CoA hydratase/carnithine racemase
MQSDVSCAADGALRLVREGHVVRLLIDRAGKRNAMNLAMWQAVPALVADACAVPGAHVLVLQSATPGLFCAGADIAEMLECAHDPAWAAASQAAINATQHALARARLPTISFVDGDCIGGGCGLALACDIRVATPQARFGITPAKLGIVYPLHDTKLLVDLVGPGQAKRLLFSGRLIDAAEALRIGLVEELGEDCTALVTAIAANSRHSTTHLKGFVRRVLDGQVAEDAETLRIFAEAFAGEDFREGAAAFVERRAPEFP